MIFDRYALAGSSGDDFESALQQVNRRHTFTNGNEYMDVTDIQTTDLKNKQTKDIHVLNTEKFFPKDNSNIAFNYSTSNIGTLYDKSNVPPDSSVENIFDSKSQTERILFEMARLNKPICDFDISKNGVFAKVNLRRGTCYGPFPLKFCNEPSDRIFSWEVTVGAEFHGWLEPLPEIPTWLKKIQTVHTDEEVNLKPQVSGFLWYETTRDIKAGEEIAIDGRQRQPIDLKDGFFNGLGMPESIQSSDQYDGSVSNCSEINTGEEENTAEKTSTDLQGNELSDDENGFDIRCEVCDRTYENLERLDDHLIEAHHFRKDEFHCDLCAQRFCHRPSLLKHRALLHNDIRKYPCENCTKVFCDPLNLQRHIRAHHIGARSHACPECGKTFATSSGLKQHTHIHSSVKPFQCEVCFKAYTQFSNLCRHKRMHADCRMQIKCSKCGQSFSTVTSLSKHKRFCDSTNSASSIGLASTGTLRHSQNQTQRNGDLNSTHRTNSGNTCASSIDMTTPPNPFFLFRTAPSFFPGFPAAYGIPGMFPPTSLQASNLPLLFSKPNVDIRLPEITPVVNGQNLLTSNGFQFHLGPKQSQPNLNADIAEIVPRCESKMSSSIKKAKSAVAENSDENSNSSFKKVIKIEEFENDERKINNKPDEVNSTFEDERREVDVTSIPMESDFKSECNSELPLDLSLNKQSKNITLDETIERKDGDDNVITNQREHFTDECSNSNQTLEVKDSEEQTYSCKSSPLPSVSPGPTPTPSPPSNDTLNGLHDSPTTAMACPRPIHPVLLEEFYRSRALGAAFQRPFPFLGQMGGRQAFDQNMHHHTASFPPEPAFREALRAVGISCSPLATATHKIKDRYTCKFCGKVFPRSANLTRHLRTHTGEQPYTCKYCDRAFSISSNLQRHVRNIHNKERPFRCHLCDRCFGQQTNLDRHLRKHEADSSGIGYGDSPSSNEADREDSYFDEIRSFMGQVTYNDGLYTPTSLAGLESDMNLSACDTENDLSTSDLTIVSDKEAKITTEAVAATT